jgi:transposase
MSRIRQILQLHSQGRSKLQIAAQTGVARNTLKKYLRAYADSKLTFEEISTLSDKDLEELFVKPEEKPLSDKLQTLLALFPTLDKELKKKGMTRQLLWERYRAAHPDGLGLSQFKHYLSQWKAQTSPTMRMEHKAGDKLFVDFAGDKLRIVDEGTGELTDVEVFVAILGAS